MRTKISTQIKRVILVSIAFLALSKGLAAQNDSLKIELNEIIVSTSFVNERSTPLRLQTISQKEIERKAVGKTYPELVKEVPGIYATSESGSYGDARINIRGFKQENISVLLNGIPISGLTSGNMFWNNWLGLTDATSSIQVQKGIGGSMLSDNSVGGTINIITKTASQSPSISGGAYYTGYGLGKSFININSGESKNGWSSSLLLSYAWGDSYAKATDVNSWAYMLNVSKKINSKNTLLITLLGSPERHQQRSARLSSSEVDMYGRDYNKNWGYLNGEAKNLSENFYHKPYLTLHHYYTPNAKLSISSSTYLSVGHGGGRWSESKGKRIIDFRKDGLIDWDSVVEENRAASTGEAENILSDYLAGHTQAGIRSSVNYKFNSNFTLESGLHYQYYSTWEKERITDLLEGDYWFENYENNSLAGIAGRNPVKHVGDYIRTDNGKITNHLTLYSMLSAKSQVLDFRFGASAMGSTNRRWDKYNYTGNIFSETATAAGYSIKAGVLARANAGNSFYANAAWYSRMPYSNLFFSSGDNTITKDVKNENNFLAEAGYRFVSGRVSFEATLYAAYWMNKTVVSDPYKVLENTSRYMIKGLDALHRGLEANINYNISHNIKVGGFLSLASWKWKNDVSANIYDDYSGQVIDEVKVYSKGLYVGDAPQRQVALFAELSPVKNLTLNIDWQYNGRLFADFEPKDRKDPLDRAQSFRLPDYNTMNISAAYDIKIGRVGATLFAACNNLFDSDFIERGKDGRGHTLESFRGFWGAGINANAGLRFRITK